MPITYDIEKDGLYLKGIAKGIIKGRSEGIAKGKSEGIAKGVIVCYEIGLKIEQIAGKFDISIEEVQRIINTCGNK